MSSENQIHTIEEKLQALLKRYQRLQKENSNLKAELHQASAISATLQNENDVLRQKVDAANLGIQAWTPQEKINMQARIDGYLKEIDNCLHLLNA